MNSPFFLQFELSRAQAQLAESLATLPGSSFSERETESGRPVDMSGQVRRMKLNLAGAANRTMQFLGSVVPEKRVRGRRRGTSSAF
jgi:hypothetical protein